MSDKHNKPPRLDKNGRPYPSGKSACAKGRAKPTKKSAPSAPTGPLHPQDWFFLHRQPFPVAQLKQIFSSLPDLDIEVWPQLQISEVTFPNKAYIDFEYTPQPPDEPPLTALLQQEGIRTVYYVSVDPVCTDAELAFLRTVAQASGGIIVADNDDLSPILKQEAP